MSTAKPALAVGFAGTPQFAATALAAIHGAGFTIPLVLTQPDRPHGRGLKLAPSPVKAWATARALPVRQPATLRTDEAQSALREVALDVLVVAAYGLILPPAVLAWPRFGCLNIHASRLPRWRGAAPIARAIEAGDAATGITIMQMDTGLDTGPMIDLAAVAIDARDTAGSLHDRLAALGAQRIVAVLERLARDGWLAATPQPAEGVTYAAKIGRDEPRLDWGSSAEVLDLRIRAFDPAPGAFVVHAGQVIKIARALPQPGVANAAPGVILRLAGEAMDVACAEGALRITAVKPAGGRSMDAAAFARGRGLVPGMRLGDPAGS